MQYLPGNLHTRHNKLLYHYPLIFHIYGAHLHGEIYCCALRLGAVCELT